MKIMDSKRKSSCFRRSYLVCSINIWYHPERPGATSSHPQLMRRKKKTDATHQFPPLLLQVMCFSFFTSWQTQSLIPNLSASFDAGGWTAYELNSGLRSNENWTKLVPPCPFLTCTVHGLHGITTYSRFLLANNFPTVLSLLMGTSMHRSLTGKSFRKLIDFPSHAVLNFVNSTWNKSTNHSVAI